VEGTFCWWQFFFSRPARWLALAADDFWYASMRRPPKTAAVRVQGDAVVTRVGTALPFSSRLALYYTFGMASFTLSEAMKSQIATKRDVDKLDARLNLVQWMVGFNLAFTMAVLWKVFS